MKVLFTYLFISLECNHPVNNIYKYSFSSCVGEDIEHGNKGLSHATTGVSGQADVDFILFLILIVLTGYFA